MTSAVERLTANFSMGAFVKAVELRKRIWFTLGALIIYRIGTYIPVPGVDAAVIGQLLAHHRDGILGLFNMFTGGALGRMTIFALNIMPYISASIIVQLMSTALPSLEALKKEGERGRTKLNQYTRYLTLFIAVFQAYGVALSLENMQNGAAVVNPGALFLITCVTSLVGGTMFLMWIGEQITSRGVGNGISLIIFAGIVANLPQATASLFQLGYTGALSPAFVIVFLCLAAVTVAFIVFMEQAYRRVIIQYPKRQMLGGDTTYMPLKVNTSGVIPPIFASSILLIPATLIGLMNEKSIPNWLSLFGQQFGRGHILYMTFYALMIVFFSYFYAAVSFNPVETADNLRKHGGFIPTIRPGTATVAYFDRVLTRLTAVAAVYLVIVCLLPQILVTHYNIPFYFGGTSLIIIVSVTIDTVSQIQSHLVAYQYQGLMRKRRGDKRQRIIRR